MVKHLPPSIKQLLTLRNPQSFPAPPAAKLHAALKATYSDAKKFRVETGWLVLSTCTLLTANTPTAVVDLYRFASRTDSSDEGTKKDLASRTDVAAKMRESALKSTIFVGVPRVILSLATMTEAFEEDVKAGLRKDSHRTPNSRTIDTFLQRGQTLWKSIYTPHDEKLYNKLGSYHPDFISFIIQSYGVVLSPFPSADNEQGNLSRAMGSIVGTACLRAETRVGPQLTSHVFGLLKARNVEGLSEEDYWLASDEGTEWVVKAVDTIYDAARGTGGESGGATPSAKL